MLSAICTYYHNVSSFVLQLCDLSGDTNVTRVYFYQGGLNNKCLTLYVGEQQASLTLTCLSTSTATLTPTKTSTKLSPTSLLFAVHLPPPPTTLLAVAAQKSAVQKICFVLEHNKKPEQTIDGSNRKEKKKKKMNSVAFPAAVNMANVRGSGLCKTQHGKRITDSMECSYFCHSFVLLCHLGKKSE